MRIKDSPNGEDLQEFFDLSLNLWCVAGTDGYFKRVNPAWEATFGYTTEELLSRPYLDFVHPDDLRHVEGVIQTAGSDKDIDVEFRIIKKNNDVGFLFKVIFDCFRRCP